MVRAPGSVVARRHAARLALSAALILAGCSGGGQSGNTGGRNGGGEASGGSGGAAPGGTGGASSSAGNAGHDAAGASGFDATADAAADAGGSRDSGTVRADSGTPGQTGCAPLPITGHAVEVAASADLVAAVRSAAPGDTLLLANGTYALGGKIRQIVADGVTLRSKSGDREAVILDGQRSSSTGEVVSVTGSDVTIADLTIVNAYTHAIHVQATDAKDTLRATIYNVHVKDALEQGIKINQNVAETHSPDDGTVACSHIELTSSGRPNVRDNCYTGGIDAHWARGWRIRDNVIEGFYCPSGLSEHGVHFWTGSRDTIVERNRILNSARGIGFGLGETTSSSTDDWRTYPDAPCGDEDTGRPLRRRHP